LQPVALAGAGATVHAKAMRLGYKASEEVQIKAS
jgi:hypothetical protein